MIMNQNSSRKFNISIPLHNASINSSKLKCAFLLHNTTADSLLPSEAANATANYSDFVIEKKGCDTLGIRNGSLLCQCNHLTKFMATDEGFVIFIF